MDEGEELPVVKGDSCCVEFFRNGVGQRKVHVVAAEQEVLANGNALQGQVAVFSCHCDEAEIRRSAADIADEQKVSGFHLFAPFGALVFQPGVKRCLWLFEKSDLVQAGLCGSLEGECAGGFVKGGRNCDDGLLKCRVGMCCTDICEQVREEFPRDLEG